MDWYPWYPHLYEQDTMHLNPYQDGCYRRLIDHYMKTRSPLPDNDSALSRIVGDSEANWVAMASLIVRSFFTPVDGRLYLKRCDDILNYQDKKTAKLSESGKKGAEKRWNKINKQDSHPIATPKATLKPIDSTIQDNTIQDIITPLNPPKGKRELPTKPDDVSDQAWIDFLAHRKLKKSSVSETVIKNFRKEADKAGISLQEAMEISVANGWQGFNSNWIKDKKNGNNTLRGHNAHYAIGAAARKAIEQGESFDIESAAQSKPRTGGMLEILARENTKKLSDS